MVRRTDKKGPAKITLWILVATAVACITAFGLIFYYSYVYSLESIKIPMDMKVSDKVGFNLDADAIHFGTTQAGSVSERGLTISHKYDFPVRVSIRTYGNLSEFVAVTDNEFLVQPGETREVKFLADVPFGVEKGSYEGQVVVVFYRS